MRRRSSSGVVRMAVAATNGRVPVLVGVAETTTAEACRFAADCKGLGADGLMVLPGMLYRSDPRETLPHYRAVARASELPAMVYNNPVSYGVDITPEMFAELAAEPTLVAIKESSENVRRITDLINTVGDRYVLFCGVDDLVLESVMLGATGWVAGFVNAFPRESVELFALAAAGRYGEARALYRWFTPLLHLDTKVKLVQYVKFAQHLVGLGSEMVRPPRLPLDGKERAEVEALVRAAMTSRPAIAA